MSKQNQKTDQLKNHLTYSWWKYLILAIVVVLGWNLIYSATAYKPPADKQITIYFALHGGIASESTEYLRQTVLDNDPNLEDATVIAISYSEDDYYGSMRLSTYMGAGEGDIYILQRDIFDGFAAGGGFVRFDEYLADGTLSLNGYDAGETGFMTDEDGVSGILYLPLENLYGLMDLGIDNRDLVLVVMGFSKNQDGAVRYVNWLFDNMTAEKPQWVVELENAELEALDQQEKEIQLPSY